MKENRDFGNIAGRASGPRRGVQASRRPDTAAGGGASHGKRKRPLGEEEGNGKRGWARGRRSWRAAQRSAVEQLNALRPGLRYEVVSQAGPLHAPLFSVRVELDGQAFQAQGPTKKKARMGAAELALRSFVQFPNASEAHLALAPPGGGDPLLDFTSDQEGFPETLFKGFEPLLLGDSLPHLRPPPAEEPPPPPALRCRGRPACHALDPRQASASWSSAGHCRTAAPSGRGKTPVVLLNELRPGLRYACLATGGRGRGGRAGRSFVMAVRVDGRIFEGSGRSKKTAKCQAAHSALRTLFAARLPPPERTPCPPPSRRKGLLLPQVSSDTPPPSRKDT